MTAIEVDERQATIEDTIAALLAAHPPATTEPADFFAAQFDAGLAMVHRPRGLGGLGADPRLQSVVERELRAAGAKSAALRNPLGVGMGIPTLFEHGTPEQIERFVRPCFTTEEIWCQLFSEPGSGSDLAGLATRAVRADDGWVVNGQKVWTSLGHVARVGMLLARTDPAAPKHRGLTFFLLDMQSDGVDVRPLRQMTGETEFNEVFLTDVHVPDSARVGAAGDGWRVAATTLQNERVVLSGVGAGAGNVGGRSIDRLIAAARQLGATSAPTVRDVLTRRYIEGELIRLTNLRRRTQRDGGPPGVITKVLQGEYNRRLQETAIHVLGARASAFEPSDADAEQLVRGFLRAQANTIEGGTSAILRNVVGERVLGLPRDPGMQADVPWMDLLRNGSTREAR